MSDSAVDRIDWHALVSLKRKLKAALDDVDRVLAVRPIVPAKPTFDPEMVRKIRARHEAGESVTKLALAFDVHRSTISRLVRYVCHKSVE